MREVLIFAGEHPLLAILLAWCCAGVLKAPFEFAFKAYNRKCRSNNIASHGWPTAPMDADGDIVYPDPEDKP